MSSAEGTLNGSDWRRFIAASAASVSDSVDELARLDAAVGDGDHGVNIVAGFAHALNEVEGLNNPLPADVLTAVAHSLLDEMGGAAGALFGSFFLSMSRSFVGHLSIGTAQLADALTAGGEIVMKRGRAGLGDKTMVDALVPAADASRAAVVSGATVAVALNDVARAARAGAESTVSMKAAFGRARYAGDSSVGVQDAGATTVALIFESWATESARSVGNAQ